MAEFLGELLGTFIIVFFGCGAVAVSVLFSAYSGLFQVAAIWGMGVTLAIYASRSLSCSHLNPAVTIAFAIAKRIEAEKIPVYLIAQIVGAFLAASVLYAVFSGAIFNFESINNIARGSLSSVRSAMMFGEYFPNPASNNPVSAVSHFTAFIAEGLGTFLLVFFIFLLTEGCKVGCPDSSFTPAFIGLVVSAIICIIAPITQAGLNPARDFGPRLFAYFAGWNKIAIPGPRGGFFTVYILAPILGGGLASIFFNGILNPFFTHNNK